MGAGGACFPSHSGEIVEEFVQLWNSHTIRLSGLATCPSGQPEDMYDMPELFGKSDLPIGIIREMILMCIHIHYFFDNMRLVPCCIMYHDSGLGGENCAMPLHRMWLTMLFKKWFGHHPHPITKIQDFFCSDRVNEAFGVTVIIIIIIVTLQHTKTRER